MIKFMVTRLHQAVDLPASSGDGDSLCPVGWMRRLQRWVSCLGLVVASVMPATGANQITRIAPESVVAGSAFVVTNMVSAAEEVLVYAVEEAIEPGWSVSQISHFGEVDLAHGKIKWGPFFDRQSRSLSFQLRPPAGTEGRFLFSGSASFNGELVGVTGAGGVTVVPGNASGIKNQVVSMLPGGYVPGGTLWLTNRVTLSPETVVYAVEESVPAGWVPGSINHGGQYDPEHGRIKWGPFLDRVARELICEFRTPAAATNVVVFRGVASFDSVEIAVSGARVSSPIVSTIVAQMPTEFRAGDLIPVELVVTPAPGIRVFAVEERIPVGWRVQSISHDGLLDADGRRIKWGPLFADGPVTLKYEVLAHLPLLDPLAVFAGTGSFDGAGHKITGRRAMTGIGSQTVRLLPGQFSPGLPFAVSVRVILDARTSVYAVEEAVPSGWTASELSDGGQWDGATGRIKWGPFDDRQERVLTYIANPPAGDAFEGRFEGTGSFDGLGVSTGGSLSIAPIDLTGANRITRSLFDSVRVGRSLSVTNRVMVAEGISVYAVEEDLPRGWTATEVNEGGTFDPASSKVKWGPFFDSSARELIYQLKPALESEGIQALAGRGSFNGTEVETTGKRLVRAIRNHVPVAADDLFERLMDQEVRISVSVLLANDSDPDQDPLEVERISEVSALGVPIRLSEGAWLYSPAAGFNQTDEFRYWVRDGFGGVSEGRVQISTVVERSGLNRVSLEVYPTGIVRLSFAGIPGRRYRIEASDTLADPVWVSLGSKTAASQGSFEFDDVGALDHPNRFYRTVAE